MAKIQITYDGRRQGHAFTLVMGDQELKLFRVPDDMESDVKIIRLCDLPHISIPNIGLQFEVTPEVIKVLNELQEYRG